MHRRSWLGAALIAGLIAGCGSDEEPDSVAGCTVENCLAALECGAGVAGGADDICRTEDPDERSIERDYIPYCVEACQVASAGESFACFSAHVDECLEARESLDGEALMAIHRSCAGPTVRKRTEQLLRCLGECEAEREACYETCPMDGWDACVPCANDCGIEWHTCSAAC